MSQGKKWKLKGDKAPPLAPLRGCEFICSWRRAEGAGEGKRDRASWTKKRRRRDHSRRHRRCPEAAAADRPSSRRLTQHRWQERNENGVSWELNRRNVR